MDGVIQFTHSLKDEKDIIMAYMNQYKKARLTPAIKAAMTKYGIKGTIAVRHRSTLVVNIKSGKLDFIANYNETISNRPGGFRTGSPAEKALDVNPYWYQEHFTGQPLEFLRELFHAMNAGNHDRSDIQTDYFDVGWYNDVNIGSWDKPYTLEK